MSEHRTIDAESLALIKELEGCRLDAYLDVAGVLTIGYGHTGRDVKPGEVITLDKAEELLAADLTRFEALVAKHVTVPLADHQFGALVSFAFNIGEGNFLHSTALGRLNRGDTRGCSAAMRWFNKATVDGKKTFVLGLARRRAREVGHFLGPGA
jgi:lysozyme